MGLGVHQKVSLNKSTQLVPRTFKGDTQGLQHARPARTEPPVSHLLGQNGIFCWCTR